MALSKNAAGVARELASALEWVGQRGSQENQEVWDSATARMRRLYTGGSDLLRFVRAVQELAKEGSSPCHGKVVEIDGKKYELKEVTNG